MATPAFIITIDTEGDNLWQNHGHITTENARFLPRFQALCEKYRFKPVYFTNYEMVMDDAFVDFARDAIARGPRKSACICTPGIARLPTISLAMTGVISLT